MRKAWVPNFEGGAEPEKAKKWIGELEIGFRMLQVPGEFKAELAASFLTGEGKNWWKVISPTLLTPILWDQFKEVFLRTYYPESMRVKRISETNK